MPRRPTVYINGKFIAQPLTGVQRVGLELVKALDGVLAQSPPAGPRWVLLCPPGASLPALGQIEIRSGPAPALPLHLWEQLVLPVQARSGVLLNLAGTGPRLAARQAMLLHDAAVFDHPQAYTRAFGSWYRSQFARQARLARPLCVVSRFSRDRLSACLGVPPSRWTVVQPGADHLGRVVSDEGVLQRLGLGHRPYFLAVGSRNPTKNLSGLLRAYQQLEAQRPALVLVGGGNRQVFAGEGPDLADPTGVVRTGKLDDAALKALYQHALALVFPSLYEGFGLPPLEAMAEGCPVVAAQAASLPEVCGEAALFVDPCSEASIAAAMQRILQDEALRRRLSDAGRLRAARFTWAESARQVYALLCAELALA